MKKWILVAILVISQLALSTCENSEEPEETLEDKLHGEWISREYNWYYNGEFLESVLQDQMEKGFYLNIGGGNFTAETWDFGTEGNFTTNRSAVPQIEDIVSGQYTIINEIISFSTEVFNGGTIRTNEVAFDDNSFKLIVQYLEYNDDLGLDIEMLLEVFFETLE